MVKPIPLQNVSRPEEGESESVFWRDDRTPEQENRKITKDLTLEIENRLRVLLDTSDYTPPNLAAAMRHALLGGGKRFRPLHFVLTILQPAHRGLAVDVGCAIEMVHTASLIFDDLPCMDDAALRRDKPTTHVVFSQSTAILAGISPLTRGMNILATIEGLPGEARARLVASLSLAVGATGLAAGQEVDLNDGQSPEIDVERKNWLKTGRLFAAMAEMACILDQRSSDQSEALAEMAFHVGSAFQALDDLLDVLALTQSLGKDSGKDIGKRTLMSERGEANTRRSYYSHIGFATSALRRCGVEDGPICYMFRSIDRLVPP
ncbi:polyprenyl synthetase family protein [Rhizobium sp. CC-YZS058]|uniref:polyprenyl synthetase family protein n=1 Tax=Rhizobium sp. CC-YZS058 TaxID=3042153 RepID=UPI002B057CF9|nr:polyprenyl synthetase family protein [Rhizobium sp. CC-YZS058]MEA3536994.1 polyprenyl synthetase family protein [Rhizobium sp. CC-YZS058]